ASFDRQYITVPRRSAFWHVAQAISSKIAPRQLEPRCRDAPCSTGGILPIQLRCYTYALDALPLLAADVAIASKTEANATEDATVLARLAERKAIELACSANASSLIIGPTLAFRIRATSSSSG